MTVAALLVAVVSLTGAGPGKAPQEMLGFVDAAELNEFCNAALPEGLNARMVCLSYITGAVDQLLAQQALDDPGNRTFCLPADVNAESIRAEVASYAVWSKSAKGVSAANFIRYALERAYPCNPLDTEVM